jgi:hypothetical protein
VEVVGRGLGEAWLTLVRANTARTNNVTVHVPGGSLLAVCRPLGRKRASGSVATAIAKEGQQAAGDLQVEIAYSLIYCWLYGTGTSSTANGCHFQQILTPNYRYHH